METERYNVNTSVGKFKVEKTKTHLRVGGKKFCVEIKFQDSKNPELAELQWIYTKDGGCELDNKMIKGDLTVEMLKLSLTILKLYREVKYVKLLDNSKYDCEYEDGSKKTIFINKYNYLFHGGTWYEKKVNAIPIDPSLKELYEETKPLYTDPSAKPSLYDFKNKLLQEELRPIYESKATWKEFANTLHEIYDSKTLCKKISPWYNDAVEILTKNRMIPEIWIIDISDINTPFTQIISGGKRFTRKKYESYIENFIMSPGELYDKKL
jgi:hypothetical protein